MPEVEEPAPLMPASTQSSSESIDLSESKELERLLSDKLLEGFVLLEAGCPSCATPLVKKRGSEPSSPKALALEHSSPDAAPILVSSKSFEKPFLPVRDVPYCVSCQAHVVTTMAELDSLERCESLKDKGSILVSLKEEAGWNQEPDWDTGGAREQNPAANHENAKCIASPSSCFSCGTHSSLRHVDDGNTAPIPTLSAIRVLSNEDVAVLENNGELHGTTHSQESSEKRDASVSEMSFEAEMRQKVTTESSIDPAAEQISQQSTIQSEARMVREEEKKEEPIPVVSEEKKDRSDEKNEETDAIFKDYSVRREIATKVLGSKMLHGYKLTEVPCSKCNMPMMEYEGSINCVVCPALLKKAKKMLKDQKDAEMRKEKERDVAEEDATLSKAKELPPLMNQEAEEEAARQEEDQRREAAVLEEARRAEEARILEEQQKRHEAQLLKEARMAEEARIAEETRILHEQQRHEADLLEQARLAEETRRLEELQRQEAELLAEAQRAEEARLESEARLVEEARLAEEARLQHEAKLAEEARIAEEERKQEEARLLEETRRLELMEEQASLAGTTFSYSAVEALRAEQARFAEHARMKEEICRAEEMKAAEEARLEAELEAKRLADEKRASEEAELLSKLEADAMEKARAAEEAIAKAKAALDEVSSARRHIIANTIAQAEQEAVAEAEAIVSAETTAFTAPPAIPPTLSEIELERWETLQAEGRSIMTRRLLQGWTLMPELCKGIKCENPPLITNGDKVECVVCGGSGSGVDGVYAELAEAAEELAEADTLDDLDEPVPMPSDMAAIAARATLASPVPEGNEALKSPKNEEMVELVAAAENKTLEELKEDFETKRDKVSKEIGRRMLEGWTLLDMSCPVCVMPLMDDGKGGPETCVLCGPMPNGQLPPPPPPPPDPVESPRRSESGQVHAPASPVDHQNTDSETTMDVGPFEYKEERVHTDSPKKAATLSLPRSPSSSGSLKSDAPMSPPRRTTRSESPKLDPPGCSFDELDASFREKSEEIEPDGAEELEADVDEDEVQNDEEEEVQNDEEEDAPEALPEAQSTTEDMSAKSDETDALKFKKPDAPEAIPETEKEDVGQLEADVISTETEKEDVDHPIADAIPSETETEDVDHPEADVIAAETKKEDADHPESEVIPAEAEKEDVDHPESEVIPAETEGEDVNPPEAEVIPAETEKEDVNPAETAPQSYTEIEATQAEAPGAESKTEDAGIQQMEPREAVKEDSPMELEEEFETEDGELEEMTPMESAVKCLGENEERMATEESIERQLTSMDDDIADDATCDTTFTIEIPADFDVNDPEALKALIAKAKGISMHGEKKPRATYSTTKETVRESESTTQEHEEKLSKDSVAVREAEVVGEEYSTTKKTVEESECTTQEHEQTVAVREVEVTGEEYATTKKTVEESESTTQEHEQTVAVREAEVIGEEQTAAVATQAAPSLKASSVESRSPAKDDDPEQQPSQECSLAEKVEPAVMDTEQQLLPPLEQSEQKQRLAPDSSVKVVPAHSAGTSPIEQELTAVMVTEQQLLPSPERAQEDQADPAASKRVISMELVSPTSLNCEPEQKERLASDSPVEVVPFHSAGTSPIERGLTVVTVTEQQILQSAERPPEEQADPVASKRAISMEPELPTSLDCEPERKEQLASDCTVEVATAHSAGTSPIEPELTTIVDEHTLLASPECPSLEKNESIPSAGATSTEPEPLSTEEDPEEKLMKSEEIPTMAGSEVGREIPEVSFESGLASFVEVVPKEIPLATEKGAELASQPIDLAAGVEVGRVKPNITVDTRPPPCSPPVKQVSSKQRRRPPRPGMPRTPVTPRRSPKRVAPRPEELSPRSSGPPRPEDAHSPRSASSRSLPGSFGSPKSRSPRRKSRKSPGVVVFGGPVAPETRSVQFDDDNSRAETVASEALGTILSRMDECKKALLSGDNADLSSQLEMADLIEKLASAALAVKKLEEMG